MPSNSLLVLKENQWVGMDYAYTPSVLGGHVSYWAKLDGMESGCVAGVYLVRQSASCDLESSNSDGTPQCPSIDLMQTSPSGFETSANPCPNGICEEPS